MEDHGLARIISLGIFAMAIAELVMGFMHLHHCPFDPEIPVWLIVCGIVSLMRVPVFVISYCNVIVNEVTVIAVAVLVFLLGIFDVGWLLRGAFLVLKRIPDLVDSNSTDYCEKELFEMSEGAMILSGIFTPLLSCHAAINLYTDRSYEAL